MIELFPCEKDIKEIGDKFSVLFKNISKTV